jgi:hypothetical protein
MTPEQIGEYLEHRGATDEEIEDFLEHFGMRGMRWGVRKDIGPSGKVRTTRSAGSKATIVVGALGGSMVGTKVASKIFRNHQMAAVTIGSAAAAGAAIMGARVARTMVDKHANVKASDLKKLRGKKLGDKGMSRGEKGYAIYAGVGMLAAAGVLSASRMSQFT